MSRLGCARPVSMKLRWRVETSASTAKASWLSRRRSRHCRRSVPNALPPGGLRCPCACFTRCMTEVYRGAPAVTITSHVRRESPGNLSPGIYTRRMFSIAAMDRHERFAILSHEATADREHGLPGPPATARRPGRHPPPPHARGRRHAAHARHADQRMLTLVWLLPDVLRWQGPARITRARRSGAQPSWRHTGPAPPTGYS